MSYSRHNAWERPNVLFILSDQLRADYTGFGGSPFVKTPVLDKLAGEGTIFSRCYVQNPTCAPSRASILTGRYPRTHRLRMNGVDMPHDEITAMHSFRNAGYRTALVGKLHFQPMQSYAGGRRDYGFDHFLIAESPADALPDNAYIAWLARKGISAQALNPKEHRGRTPYPFPLEAAHHYSTWVADQSSDYIRSSARLGIPFFLNASFFDPHHPYTAPEPWFSHHKPGDMPAPDYYPGMHDRNPPLYEKLRANAWGKDFPKTGIDDWKAMRAAYAGQVEHLDHSIGSIIKTLDETGQIENTIVCFVSDHGDMLGDKGLFEKGPYHYEEIIRVPAFIRAPKSAGIRAGRVNGIVESIDLLPTLYDLCGVPIGEGVQGKSMFNRSGSLESQRGSVIVEDFHVHCNTNCTTLVTEEWKYTRFEGESWGDLYNLKEDPKEHNNLWEKAPDLRSRMCDLLCERLVATTDRLPLVQSSY